jgi:VWFA-related protein
VAVLVVAGVGLIVGPAATSEPQAQAQQQKPPVFRSGIELMQLDVTVRDRGGNLIRGLAKDDFTLLEDNTPQTIEAFTAVDLPDAPATRPAWAMTVPRDVTSNDVDGRRVFVLIVDDARGMGINPGTGLPDPWAVRAMKENTRLFFSLIGAGDLVALIFTNNTRANQNFTTDHARLMRAVQAYPEDGGAILMPMRGSLMGPCLGEKYSVGLVEAIVERLTELPGRRKAIVYFGGSLPWASGPDTCATYFRWRDIFAAAEQSHVTINPVDTMGRIPPAEHYVTVAEQTGGHAVVGSNDLAPGIRQIFLENSSYYLLAYQPTRANDGRFRRITVRVNRENAEVSTRRSYWAPREARATDAPKEAPPPEVEAMAGLLPVAGLKLRATAAPFAVPGTERAIIALALGVQQPPQDGRASDLVDVLIRAFTADGEARSSEAQAIPITIPAARRGIDVSRYETLAQIEVPKPGRYEIRLSAHSALSDTRGSVFVDLEVPDFRRDRLSLSGVVVSALPGAPVEPRRALAALMPATPTTERVFAQGSVVTSFVRVYQGGNDRLAPVALAVTVQDSSGTTVVEHAETLAADRFGDARAADYQWRVPLDRLSPGEYLVTLTATLDRHTARRDVVMEVR